MEKSYTNIGTAIIFNGAMIALFLQALLRPEANADWIFRGAFLIFIFEFLAIFAQLWPMKLVDDWKKSSAIKRTGVVVQGVIISLFILGFTFGFSYLAGNVAAGGYFVISMIAKYVSHVKNGVDHNGMYAGILIFMGTLMVTMFTSPVWPALFPFPAEVLAQKIDSSSGIFVDTPQVQLVWGAFYFLGLLLYEMKKPVVDDWFSKNVQVKKSSD